ncbi:DNA ligase [Streptomyces sp. NPDC085481]|uniref:ATP-dependent DNA ligase n=1 Tax=Streptomyces sp. NPDC085481 TaxID=3365727 RepID=UPI0037D7492E
MTAAPEPAGRPERNGPEPTGPEPTGPEPTGPEPAGPDAAAPGVVLRPPVDVMRPRSVDEIPRQGSVPGGLQYSLKLDGFRALAFVLDDGQVFLQSRARRDLAPEFPGIAAYLGERLPAGTVLDGELCAYREGRLSFTDLLRSHRDRERTGVPVSYIAFDLLALPGRDLRARPLRERWELLGAALEGTGPPLQRVLATDDEATARDWFGALREAGVEGIVAKAWSSAYRPGGTWSWRKIRYADTRDAQLIGVFGPPDRPHAALVRLPDGRTLRTSPRLTGAQAREVAELTAGLLAGPMTDPEHGTVRPLTAYLPVELRQPAGRGDTARFVRVREGGGAADEEGEGEGEGEGEAEGDPEEHAGPGADTPPEARPGTNEPTG